MGLFVFGDGLKCVKFANEEEWSCNVRARAHSTILRNFFKQTRRYISRAVGEQCQAGVDGYLTWPNCRDHYELVTTNSAFYAWVWDSMGSSHGPVHLWLGGNIDCDSAYNQIGDLVGAEIAEIFAFLANGHRKGLFCAKVWGCKRNASVDEKPKEVKTKKVLLVLQLLVHWLL